jgi:monoamine oxidase
MANESCDVLIIGAGFAGAAAASVLQLAGYRTIVLEARDRAGGRAFTRRLADGADMMEFGGSWIAPGHQRIRHYAEKCGFLLRPATPVQARLWHDGASLRGDAPASPAELKDYESARSRIIADARASAQDAPVASPLSEITMTSYLHRINAGRALRAQAMAWWCISGNGDPNLIAASEFISSCAHGDGSPEGMMHALKHSFVLGASELVRRMIESSGALLRLNREVKSIQQFRRHVLASCANGESYEARLAIVAVPLNVLAHIRFAPALSRRKAEAAARGHGGRSFKIWIKAEGPAPGTLVTGGLVGIQWAFVEREATDGHALIVGFGLADGSFDPSSEEAVEQGLKRFFPGARLLAWDWHDWVEDPFSRGTWLALPASAAWIADSREWQADDKLFFASADFAPETPGWFESAIRSGEAAARGVIAKALAAA